MMTKLGLWLKGSPVAIALGFLGSVVSFSFVLALTCFQVYQLWGDIIRNPKIKVNMTTSKRYAASNMGQILSRTKNYTISGPIKEENFPLLKVPVMNGVVSFSNPSRHAMTFLDCRLNAVFSNGNVFSSEGYIEVTNLNDPNAIGNQAYYLRQGEAKTVNLAFFFLGEPKLSEIWLNDSVLLDLNLTSVSCKNEQGQAITST